MNDKQTNVGNLANSRKFYSYANLLETTRPSDNKNTNQQTQKIQRTTTRPSKPYILSNSIIQYYDVDEKPLSLKSQSSYYLSSFQDDDESSSDEEDDSSNEKFDYPIEHRSLKSSFELSNSQQQQQHNNQFIDRNKLNALGDKQSSPVHKSTSSSKNLSPELNENIKNLSQFLIKSRSRSSSPRASFKNRKSFNQKHSNRISPQQSQPTQNDINSNSSTISSNNSIINGSQDEQFYLVNNQILANKVAEQYIKENYGLLSTNELKSDEPTFNAFDLKSLRYSFNKVLKRKGWSQTDNPTNNLNNGRQHGKPSIDLARPPFNNNNDLRIVNRQIKKDITTQDSSTSLMQLISNNQKLYWCELPSVRESGILDKLDAKQRQLQEAHFELIASEASYLRSLNLLIKNFYMNTFFCDTNIIDARKKEDLFSNITDVLKVSNDLFDELEQRWLESVNIKTFCDIIYKFSLKKFQVYMKYCRFKKRQERTLKQLQEKPKFNGILRLLESDSKCQGLSLHSFLLSPVQRITRYPLLIEAILNRTDSESETYQLTQSCLQKCNDIVMLCNAAAKQYEDYEDLIPKLKFTNIKCFPTLSARWLIDISDVCSIKQEIQSTTLIGSFRTPNWSKSNVCIILLSDLIVIAKKKNDDIYIVIDFCNCNSIEIYDVHPIDKNRNFKHLIKLVFLCNYANKKVEFFFNFISENEKLNWLTLALKNQKKKSKKQRSIDTFNLKFFERPNIDCTNEMINNLALGQQKTIMNSFNHSTEQQSTKDSQEWSDEIFI